ncbi:periostin-like [Argonauta hians]
MLNNLSLFLVVCLAPFVAATTPNIMAKLADINATVMMELIEAADLADYIAVQGPMTLICPTDEAFRKQPADYIDNLMANKTLVTDYIRYHLVHGDIFSWDISHATNIRAQNGHILRFYFVSRDFGDQPTLSVNSANVLQHDIQANNGVIQLVDDILSVPQGTVEEVLSKNPNLQTLTNITFISHLNSMLNTSRAGHRKTVFAPTDEAFQRVDPAIMQKILTNKNLARQLMRYHIHPGTLSLEQLRTIRQNYITSSLFLDDIHLSVHDGHVVLDHAANVTSGDVQCDNGVVHFIDRVLVPYSLRHLG